MSSLRESVSIALLELKNAATSASLDTIKDVMDKYDMLFFTDKLNTIMSIELLHSLNTYFGLSISRSDLMSLLPEICDDLGMSYEGLIAVKNAGDANPPVETYYITLF